MLRFNFFDIFFRLIPEVCTLIYVIATLSQVKIEQYKYIISNLTLIILIYIVSLLPIYYGVHVIINLILAIGVVTIMGIPLIKSIRNTVIAFLILQLCEIFNIFIFFILKINITNSANFYLKS